MCISDFPNQSDVYILQFIALFNLILAVDNLHKAKWLECMTQTLVEFTHEFDPEMRTNTKKRENN